MLVGRTINLTWSVESRFFKRRYILNAASTTLWKERGKKTSPLQRTQGIDKFFVEVINFNKWKAKKNKCIKGHLGRRL